MKLHSLATHLLLCGLAPNRPGGWGPLDQGMTGTLFQATWTQRDCRNMLQLSRQQSPLEGRGH